ncbi:hypothetical protein M422DRAFT_41118 [Sphaerobolus stellatus SS14]|uniref:Uncharacterized protein n=1 Tax=Sphaerobolus stellatus (strain SS14) TaxID=990650 RepID=A0A0C9VBK5_SPHS4|nr:hypothetical protein M422DRAFT_51804 [Sphaerobolus stellatus SS14]KIJ56427.1 hypothetical protein M422DRAFT_41118 [Sphaerobolus stellatus SS14]
MPAFTILLSQSEAQVAYLFRLDPSSPSKLTQELVNALLMASLLLSHRLQLVAIRQYGHFTPSPSPPTPTPVIRDIPERPSREGVALLFPEFAEDRNSHDSHATEIQPEVEIEGETFPNDIGRYNQWTLRPVYDWSIGFPNQNMMEEAANVDELQASEGEDNDAVMDEDAYFNSSWIEDGVGILKYQYASV